ncbi:hypothetical protein HR45_11560 [Shewanella mangrovi]|uniref:DUF885 domain-containing protein n=1 Tax=Shewanella mangrovi TaxID=1515746 RepID=A0A094JGZ2_9GAMM|nr:DUF885 domain-containing protein [Shewanella mangrovi]KFZ37299.1 hypothetical protein HR45_11560 [Shewanella mangrovi]
MKKMLLLACAVSCSLSAAEPQWVKTSNQYAMDVLSVMAQQQPEVGSQLGIEQVDGLASNLSLAAEQKAKQTILAEIVKLSNAKKQEQDPRVQQDLQIMIDTLQQQVDSADITDKYALPFYNVGEFVFSGLQTLLDDRNSPARMKKAVERLNNYVGANGNTDVATQAMQRTQAALTNGSLKAPYHVEVEQAIANTDKFLDGTKQLFIDHKIEGWQQPFATLTKQLHQYHDWLQQQVLPIASKSNVMPEPLYQSALKGYGVDEPPRQLMQQALFEFAEIRDEMQVLATDIAKQQGLKDDDYRAVIRELKKKQVTGDQVLPFFKQRLATIEQIVKQHDIVTIPKRQANIRVASAAETAALPAAHMNPPRLIGNQGEYGEFVLPMLDPASKGSDFTGEGFSWTLTAHEARPGHELQFSAMVENGVSSARAIFAMNSANVEGWALYAEAIMKQYFPKEGQLFVLQARLQRAARAFLDPMLNLGMMTPAEAEKVLTDDVVLSDSFAKHEVERYTFRMPGQATSYFYGYMNLRELRVTTEMKLRDKFNQKHFHDFILAQGLLPPKLLKQAVEDEFIPSVK